MSDNMDVMMSLSAGEQAAAGIFGTLGIVLVLAGLLYLLKRWMQGPQVTSKAKLDGKTVVITGSNTGIGRTTALDMSRRGAKVDKDKKVAADIRDETRGEFCKTLNALGTNWH